MAQKSQRDINYYENAFLTLSIYSLGASFFVSFGYGFPSCRLSPFAYDDRMNAFMCCSCLWSNLCAFPFLFHDPLPYYTEYHFMHIRVNGGSDYFISKMLKCIVFYTHIECVCLRNIFFFRFLMFTKKGMAGEVVQKRQAPP